MALCLMSFFLSLLSGGQDAKDGDVAEGVKVEDEDVEETTGERWGHCSIIELCARLSFF